MADFISREDLIKALETDYNSEWSGVEEYVDGARDEYDDVLKIICAMPSADVQPIRHGRWTDNVYKYVTSLDAYFIQAKCSVCGRYSDRIDIYSKFMSNECCSRCGARMDGEKHD